MLRDKDLAAPESVDNELARARALSLSLFLSLSPSVASLFSFIHSTHWTSSTREHTRAHESTREHTRTLYDMSLLRFTHAPRPSYSWVMS